MTDNLNSKANCVICGGSNISVIGKPETSDNAKKYVKLEYSVMKCKNCKFYFVFPRISLSDKEWQELYADGYFTGMTQWWAKKRERDRRQRLDWLCQNCSHPINRFLDISCGEGYVLVDAMERGWHAHGIDVSDNRIYKAKVNRIPFSKGDLFRASFPDNYFDCIYMDSVLEHVIDPLAHLKELNRILRPGGVMYVGVPNEDSLFNECKKVIFVLLGKSNISSRIKPFKHPYHVIGFTRHSLRIMLTKTGFEILKIRDFAGLYEWRKFRSLSKSFIMHLMSLPIQLTSFPLQKRIYIDTVVRKTMIPKNYAMDSLKHLS
jgi:ubiquinone/menaquinone biosynthesis C-methylase UbiE